MSPAQAASSPLQLAYHERSPPLAILAAAELSGVSLDAKADPKLTKDSQPLLQLGDGEELEGTSVILRYLARAGTKEQLYGADALTACQVDQWLDFAPALVAGAGLEGACAAANEYLSLRAYLAGYSLSLADLAVWGQLAANLQWEKLRKGGGLPHLARWYDFVSQLTPLRALADAHLRRRKTPAELAKDAAAAGKGGGDTGSFDINLPDAVEGKVVTRFPPEPSGYLHIGHAKAALMNQYIAQMYKGKVLLRFDDTNPSKEKDEFVETILQDVKTLGIDYAQLSYTSDYFPQLLDMGERLIKAGLLYADDTPVDQMREERMEGIESKRRSRSVEENLAMWKEMQAGSEVGLTNCMRFKIDMQAANKALRDPVAYRCNVTPHHRTGTKYKVYPTYDCACPFVDAYEGVTHALRTSEYKDREDQFHWVLKAMQSVWPELPRVHIWEFSRLAFVNTVLSKRKLTWFVEKGLVEGWEDPRFPTVRGLFRRGLQLEALKEFIISQGASKNITLQEWDKIWTINKRIIDPVCPRHTAIEAAGRVRLHLTNGPARPEVVTLPRHKKHPPAGVKASTRTQDIWLEGADAAAVKEGEEVTLMDWGNAFIRAVERGADGAVSGLTGELHLAGDFKKTKLKLTWLPVDDDLVPLSLVDFGPLITKKKIDEDDVFEDHVNPHTRWEVAAEGDANMRTLQRGDVLQLERKGYYIVDQPLISASKPLVLLTIPDGRAAKAAPPAAAAAAGSKAGSAKAGNAADAGQKGNGAKQAAAPGGKQKGGGKGAPGAVAGAAQAVAAAAQAVAAAVTGNSSQPAQ